MLSNVSERGNKMRLAGHLCGSRCREVLNGEVDFVRKLADMGFKRVQVNATQANGVDSSKLNEHVASFRKAVESVPNMEWIVQMNEETKRLWEPLISSNAPKNMSVLFDASCGKGVLPESFRKPHEVVPCGYAGGIGPDNVADVMKRLGDVTGDVLVWTDMESSLREIRDGKDCFSITKSFACASRVADLGIIGSFLARHES